MFHIKPNEKTSIPMAINNSAFRVDIKLSLHTYGITKP
jgi:hypothetical protein